MISAEAPVLFVKAWLRNVHFGTQLEGMLQRNRKDGPFKKMTLMQQ
jgi:hypothetical protein